MQDCGVNIMTKKEEALYQNRLTRHIDELRWLYMELYGNDAMFAELCDNLHRFAEERSASLKERDLRREADPECDWFSGVGSRPAGSGK